jgi:hypothetical protein
MQRLKEEETDEQPGGLFITPFILAHKAIGSVATVHPSQGQPPRHLPN